MELIQYSHLEPSMNMFKILYNFSKNKIKINIDINRGKILIINSSLLHRGIFINNKSSRIVIQIFDVFKNKIDFDKYSDIILHIPSNINENNSLFRNLAILIAKNMFIINIINFILYLNAVVKID